MGGGGSGSRDLARSSNIHSILSSRAPRRNPLTCRKRICGRRSRVHRCERPEAVMRIDVVTTVDIRAPLLTVATFAADPNNVPRWYANIDSVRWRTGSEPVVGARIDFEATFLRRRLTYTYEIVEHVPGERLRMSTTDGPFAMETTYAWRDIDESSTRMSLRNRGTPPGMEHLLSPLVGVAVRRANRKDLAQLKAVLEG